MNVRNGVESAFGPGQIIADRYEVVQHLGAGAMGTVLRAIDRTLDNEPVALKLLYPHLVSDGTIFARFRNEVLLARRLAHPNIVRIYDFGKAAQGYYFISMEYVTGSSLKERIYSSRYEPLRFDEVLRILYEIGQGVSHAHRQGVIHRDLKPDNILISDRGEVKITDFGLARQATADKGFTQSGETVGTPCYMAPEQIRGERVDQRADIYSLGIMAYELVTGEKPFDDDNWLTLASMHLKEPLPEFPPDLDVPEWFADFVEKSTAKDPEDRYQNADDWSAEIQKKIFGTQSVHYSPAVFSSFVAAVQRKSRKGRARRKLVSKLGILFGASLALTIIPPVVVRNVALLQAPVMRLITSIESAAGVDAGGMRKLFGLSVAPTVENLRQAVDANSASAVRLLLASGVPVMSTDAAGYPLFLRACQTGKVNVVAEFLDAGADINLSDPKTPLMAAAEGDASGAVISLLLSRGLPATALDKSGDSALAVALKNGNVAGVQHLVEKGAFVNARDSGGNAPLILAIGNRSVPAAQALIDAGARLNDPDAQGLTPLMLAAKLGDAPLTNYLLSRGADATLKNPDGRTAKDIAKGDARAVFSSAQKQPVAVSGSSRADMQNPTNFPALKDTRLRAVGDPEGVWERGRILKLRNVKVTVRNVGDSSAEGVRVQVTIPGGRMFTLSGPQQLEPNAVTDYSLAIPDADQQVTSAGELRATLSCKNCRL